MRSPAPAKITDMIADDRAAAQRGEADVARAARAGEPVARPGAVLGKIDSAPMRGRLAEQQRRAGGRVDLHLVMHLDDLHVPGGAERLGGALHQNGEKIDAEAHIAGAHDDGALGGRGEGGEVLRARGRWCR